VVAAPSRHGLRPRGNHERAICRSSYARRPSGGAYDKNDINDKRYLNGCNPQPEGGLMSFKSFMSYLSSRTFPLKNMRPVQGWTVY
jgi:hypothetical protein